MPGDVDEYNIRRRFQIGNVYELPVQLAATLIIAGFAQNATPSSPEIPERKMDRLPTDLRAEAADRMRRPRRRAIKKR